MESKENNTPEKEYQEHAESFDEVKQYIKELPQYKKLDPEEEKALFEKRETHFDTIFSNNLRLVVSVASKYKNYCGRYYSLSDLISEGNIGLSVAIRNYDITRGIAFSTYATINIQARITAYIHRYGRTITRTEQTRNIEFAKIRFEKENKKITPEKIAKEVDLKLESVIKYLAIEEVPFENRYGTIHPDILDKSITEDESNIEIKEVVSKILTKLEELDPRKKMIIENRYALIPKSLREIAEILDITHERVRQIETDALNHCKVYFKMLDLDPEDFE